jgi:hypothetical protein
MTGKHLRTQREDLDQYINVKTPSPMPEDCTLLNGTTVDVPRPPVGDCERRLVTTCGNMEDPLAERVLGRRGS